MAEEFLTMDTESTRKLGQMLHDAETAGASPQLLTEEVITFGVNDPAGFKFEIFSREHGEPHFHVTYDQQMASFTLHDCSPLAKNQKLKRCYKKIRNWWSEHKWEIVDFWNNRRPDDCPVGPMGYPPEWGKRDGQP